MTTKRQLKVARPQTHPSHQKKSISFAPCQDTGGHQMPNTHPSFIFSRHNKQELSQSIPNQNHKGVLR